MPAHHHRTVDRVAALLDHVACQPRGAGLSDLARVLGAPKSSIQSLVNGLVASGYLVEQGHKYFLGPAPFVLTLMTSPTVAMAIRHDQVVELHDQLASNVLVGIRVGDTLVYIDQAGDGPMMEFLAYSHRRRPLLTTATGKVILANLPPREMQGILAESRLENEDAVEQFLEELPSIRRTGLAFNLGATIPDLFAVASGLFDGQGHLVAGICVNGGCDLARDLDKVGRDLLRIIRSWPECTTQIWNDRQEHDQATRPPGLLPLVTSK